MTTCTSCLHWSPKQAGSMARHGFGVCVVLNTPWVFLPPHQTCAHHRDAKPDVVRGRVVWLEKLRGGR